MFKIFILALTQNAQLPVFSLKTLQRTPIPQTLCGIRRHGSNVILETPMFMMLSRWVHNRYHLPVTSAYDYEYERVKHISKTSPELGADF